MHDDDDDDLDPEFDDDEIGEGDCTWCGGDGLMDNDDPLWYGADELVDCSACNGTGMRKHQTIFKVIMNSLLTPEELAAHYKISVKRIYALVRTGKLLAVRLPGSRLLRFDPANLTPAGENSPTKVLRFSKSRKAA